MLFVVFIREPVLSTRPVRAFCAVNIPRTLSIPLHVEEKAGGPTEAAVPVYGTGTTLPRASRVG